MVLLKLANWTEHFTSKSSKSKNIPLFGGPGDYLTSPLFSMPSPHKGLGVPWECLRWSQAYLVLFWWLKLERLFLRDLAVGPQ